MESHFRISFVFQLFFHWNESSSIKGTIKYFNRKFASVGGQIIKTVKYADDRVLMDKEETVLQGMIDKLIETSRYYGIEINVEKK